MLSHLCTSSALHQRLPEQLPYTSFSLSPFHPLASAMTTISLIFSDPRKFLLIRDRFTGGCLERRNRLSPRCRQHRVYCENQPEQINNVEIRRCPPFLESMPLTHHSALLPSEWRAVPDIWRSSAERFGARIALVDPYHDPPTNMTYNQLEQGILNFSEGLRVIGVKPGEKLALFADNSCRWLVADQGIMATGAINVVRGSRSSMEELLQIYKHSESVALVVDSPDLLSRIAETFCGKAAIRFIVLLWGEKSYLPDGAMEGLPIFNYEDIVNLGQDSRMTLSQSSDARQQYTYEAISSDDVATLMYTSGTTGNPKGIMITHQNLLHQIKSLWDIVPAAAGDKFLSMLPPWHAYERACEYFIFTHGVEQFYSTVKSLKDDLRRYQPHYLISVPLVYETLYSGIQKQIALASAVSRILSFTFIRISLAYMQLKRIYEGMYLTPHEQHSSIISMLDCLCARVAAAILWPIHMLAKKIIYRKIHASIGISKAGISGGGSLPAHVDRFFEAVGVRLQNGYGLTEASPVVSARRPHCNVLGSVGHPLPHTEIKIVNFETGKVVPDGSKGIVKVRGQQVMKGYYKNSLATMQALDESGWLSTGDIGWIAPHHSAGRSRFCGGMLVLDGRAKDTIVLSTGENVEPSELEEAAVRSRLIEQIVVIGQDQRCLGALIVPNKEAILLEAKRLSILNGNVSDLGKEKLTGLLHKELRIWTSECSFPVGPLLVVDEPFTIENGMLTPTMKIRRDRVLAQYNEEIANLYKRNPQ